MGLTKLRFLGSASCVSVLRKRSVVLAGHATSLALEPEFWDVLKAAARQNGCSLSALIAEIDSGRNERPLASACRVAALGWALDAPPPDKA